MSFMSNSENSELIFASWINLQATQLGSHNLLQASSFMTIPFLGSGKLPIPINNHRGFSGLSLGIFFLRDVSFVYTTLNLQKVKWIILNLRNAFFYLFRENHENKHKNFKQVKICDLFPETNCEF